MEVRVLTVGCKSDLEPEPDDVIGSGSLSDNRPGVGNRESRAGGGGNVVALFVNSWCQGHEVMFFVHINVRYTHIHNIHVRDEPSGIALQTKWNSIDLHELENKIMQSWHDSTS